MHWTQADIEKLMKEKGLIINDMKVIDAEVIKPKLNNVFIGIDPDVEKSGVAFKEGELIELSNLSFFELYEYLLFVKQSEMEKKQNVLVVVEGGWLNKGNWHKKQKGSAALNAKIGSRTGANHETGKKIVEMLLYLDIPHKITRPTKTKVKSADFKIITNVIGQTNQEQRDACMLIYGLK